MPFEPVVQRAHRAPPGDDAVDRRARVQPRAGRVLDEPGEPLAAQQVDARVVLGEPARRGLQPGAVELGAVRREPPGDRGDLRAARLVVDRPAQPLELPAIGLHIPPPSRSPAAESST